jgi:hypothetical protein
VETEEQVKMSIRLAKKRNSDAAPKRPVDMTKPADGVDAGLMDPVGPTDETGRPLFGLAALRALKRQQEPASKSRD